MNQAGANATANMPAIRRAIPVKKMAGMFQGQPAVVCGAGPSLPDCIPAIRKYRNRIKLLAADRSVRFLAASGIAPDYVCTLEWGQGTEPFFMEPPGASLLFHQATHPSFVMKWKGPVITYNAPGSNRGLGSLDGGGHVGHIAIAFAHLMGCVPIVLCGVDLAYRGGETHAPGHAVPGDREKDTLLVDSVTGGLVETGRTLKVGIDHLARFARATRWRIVQTSPFGARVDGLLELPVEKALALAVG